jgi:transcriptional regulator EpsA
MSKDWGVDFIARSSRRNWLQALPVESRASLLLTSMSDLAVIQEHSDLYLWLNGEIQHFMPHRILIAAWGNFAAGDLALDVSSGMSGVRTRELAKCRSQTIIARNCHLRWIGEDARPLVLRTSEFAISASSCKCALHTALGTLCTLFVHGVRDRRHGVDNLYIAFNSDPIEECTRQRFVDVADSVIAQVDYAFRKVGLLGVASEDLASHPTIGNLSEREREIMQWLGQGKTNVDIGALLNISPFTVKNHIHRILRKFGVANRTHAAAKYNDALRSSMTNNSRPSLDL